MPRNILFIMCDQLRWDYLSCYGHPGMQTPNIDSLAERGVRFDNAYCQSPTCGPSRASFYSGRYMSSHGVIANPDPMRVDEMSIGDYLRPSGYRTALVGKTDNRKDPELMRALGVEPFELHEGRSLMPLLRSATAPADWRGYAISEIDYAERGLGELLGIAHYDCRAVMIRSRRWKYIHHHRFRPQLYDLQRDPQELVDLGEDPDRARVRGEMQRLLVGWRQRLKPRVGVAYDDLAGRRPARDEARGIVIGRW